MTDKLWEEAERAYKEAYRFCRYNDLTRSVICLRLSIKRAEDLIFIFEKELKDKG